MSNKRTNGGKMEMVRIFFSRGAQFNDVYGDVRKANGQSLFKCKAFPVCFSDLPQMLIKFASAGLCPLQDGWYNTGVPS